MQRLRYSQYLKSIFILIDLCVLSVVFAYFYYNNPDGSSYSQEKNATTLFILGAYWLMLSGKTLLYSVPRNLTYTNYLERFFNHIFFFALGVWLLSIVLEDSLIKDNRHWFLLVLLLLMFSLKSSFFFFLKHIRRKGKNHRNIMFLGGEASVEILRRTIEKRKDYGFKVLDFNAQITLENLLEFWKEYGIHTIFYHAEEQFSSEFERKLFECAEQHKIQIKIIPDVYQNHFFSYDLEYIEAHPILSPARFPLAYFSNFAIKRGFDIVFSFLFLALVGSWLFPILIILIRMGSAGSAFFVQKRYGYHNQVFDCYKFRTMRINEDSATKTTATNDCRITPIGRFLRKTSLDETPQFINVLLGTMSVVGPRPHMTVVDDHYKTKIKRYNVRSLVKPGITGLAQVNGLRGDQGDMNIEMKKRILADTFYVKNWSFSLDLVIVFKTLVLLIKGDKHAQ